MNFSKIIFSPLDISKDVPESTDYIQSYLACLYKNGQILRSYELVKTARGYSAFITLPERDSLNQKYNNIYVADYLEKIKLHFNTDIEFIGKNLNVADSCACKAPSEWYLLNSQAADESPVICGKCGKSVPLYTLPYIRVKDSGGYFEDEYYSVLSWQENYNSLDRLWMACLSDESTYAQLNAPDSLLSQEGIYICKEFEFLTGIPFYYYIFHDSDKKTPDICPSCGNQWTLNSKKAFTYYRCETCRLAADNV